MEPALLILLLDILTRLGEDAMPVNPPDPIHTLRASDF